MLGPTSDAVRSDQSIFEIQAGWPNGFHNRRGPRYRPCEAEALLEAAARVIISDIDPRSSLGAGGTAEQGGTLTPWCCRRDEGVRRAQPRRMRATAASTSWWRMPASPGRTPGETMSTRSGARSSTSISTASTGRAANSGGRCSNAGMARSSRSARCPAHLEQAAAAGALQCRQGRRPSPDALARRRMGRARGPGEHGGADLCRHGDVARRLHRPDAIAGLDGEHADEAGRARRRDRLGDPVPGERRIECHDRIAAVVDCGYTIW